MQRLRHFWRRLSTGSRAVILLVGIMVGVIAVTDGTDSASRSTPTTESPASPALPEPAPVTSSPPPTRPSDTSVATALTTSSTTSGTTATSTSTTTATTTARTTTSPSAAGVPVSSVVDGDTLAVVVDGVEERLRLIGINSPESDECFASEATEALAELVQGTRVRLEMDVSDRDQFQRLLRYVYVGDVFVNERLVEGGFALARRYPPDTAHAARLEAAQQRAQAEEVGLWAADGCGPAGSADVDVGTIHYDAEGDDNHNLNDEWVEVVNLGGTPLDLTGWGVKDESASHRYGFPSEFSLAAGATVTLHTGCGVDSASDLFWCNQGSAVWNNGGDTVFLLDPAGNIVVSKPYRADES